MLGGRANGEVAGDDDAVGVQGQNRKGGVVQEHEGALDQQPRQLDGGAAVRQLEHVEEDKVSADHRDVGEGPVGAGDLFLVRPRRQVAPPLPSCRCTGNEMLGFCSCNDDELGVAITTVMECSMSEDGRVGTHLTGLLAVRAVRRLASHKLWG